MLYPLALLWAMTKGSRCARSSQGWEGRLGCCDSDGIARPMWKEELQLLRYRVTCVPVTEEPQNIQCLSCRA